MSDTGATFNMSGTALIWAVATMFVSLVLGVVLLAIFLPEGRDVATLVGQLVGSFAVLTTAIGTWITVRRVRDKVDQVEEVVNAAAQDTARVVEQTNGNLDHRIRAHAYDSMVRALSERLDDDKAERL